MQKLKFFLIILILSACNKTDKQEQKLTVEQDTTVAETTLYTEEEAWLMFDEFWVEFQAAVVEGDTVRLREMCELSEESFNWFLESVTFPEFKEVIKRTNKKNNYEYYDNRSRGINVLYGKYRYKKVFYINAAVDTIGGKGIPGGGEKPRIWWSFTGIVKLVDGKYKFSFF